MRRLILLRHAKSSWKLPLPDRDRPLSERGKRDAPRMAEELRSRVEHLDLILSSPAVRARVTAETFARAFDLRVQSFRVDERLYMARPVDFGIIIRELPDLETVLLAGHSTGMDELYHILAPDLEASFPTCTVACLNLPLRSWSEFRQRALRAWKIIPRQFHPDED